MRSPVALNIDSKIAKTMGIRLEYSEGIQAQRYDIGQQFKAHTDFFEPGTPEYARFGAERGNRTWTFMVYLNDGMSGGGTKFFAIGHTFLPKKGQAVLWNNLNPDGTPNAGHAPQRRAGNGRAQDHHHQVVPGARFRAHVLRS
ncbi:MAG: 2OG-Fe(II) oxygenase [Gammaproteobacteria bacterium]